MIKRKTDFVIFYLFALFFIVTIGFPFFWQVSNSFKLEREIFDIKWLPSVPTISNYTEAFIRQPLQTFLLNSFIIAGLSTAFAMILGSMTAYAIARTDIKGKKIILLVILSVSLLPPIVIISPIYNIIRSIHLLNTHAGLIIVNTLFCLTTTVWFLTPYFQSVPKSLEDAAEIDGASPFLCFVKIMIPIVMPGVFTVGILSFIGAWNEYLFALVMNPVRVKTVTVGLKMYESDNYIPWGTLMAASVVIVIPLIAVVLILQKKIISGLMAGGLKE
ncbi:MULTISPECIES: carbohydrate ABC transporter permease [unclassified Oceanispirochaeta]|uniref:carbohydrate ABC transporter permease n=1 Tax=unclassified Oceanispirochaeta TaxID=2635722 RepID=UPI000E090C6C|nr:MULTISPECIES: carbohydrate ABC transporter permease [unclassified Oceanispirochaeta]MBF9017533.1 carbohydrate ABC transporter permease [Oceanispirochaeta sp. M2]NPD74105.1 carbohydrate ABC transporter permease [Oceanispirochaeta sp. M1]RDG30027.1 carbohydrate ABC transporter permease [Oceanispirochaeta sp. M1]